MCAQGLTVGGESRYKFYIVVGATFCVAIQRATRTKTRQRGLCDTALSGSDTAHNARGMGLDVMIQFCITVGVGEGGQRYGRR